MAGEERLEGQRAVGEGKGIMLVTQGAAVYWVLTLCDHHKCHITDPLSKPARRAREPYSQMGKGKQGAVTSDPRCMSSGSRKPLRIPGRPIPPEPGHGAMQCWGCLGKGVLSWPRRHDSARNRLGKHWGPREQGSIQFLALL